MQHGIKRINLSEEAKRAKLEKDKAKIVEYKQLSEKVFSLRDDEVYSFDALKYTSVLLKMNPEFYTIWNYRRDILTNLKYEQEPDNDYAWWLSYDLGFLMSLLKKFPKVYWIWNHRSWCLFELVKLGKVNWQYEFGVVSKLLELDSRNFHGWQYRRFVVENIELESTKKAAPTNKSDESSVLLEIDINEFKYTTEKISKNISNFSAWHNRSKLIPKIYHLFQALDSPNEKYPEVFEIFKSPQSILNHELELIKTGMYMDADDTSVWLYLYWLLTEKLFIDDLNKSKKGRYLSLLKEELHIVEELNKLEKDDHVENWDNCWCLKTIVLIKGLIEKEEKGATNPRDLLTNDIKNHLRTLIKIDPLRKGKYLDQLEGKASIIPTI
ncbi:geranylgeranyl transferase type II alpha subunit [Scheffersomyces xylosifermentans]|uniref:geranylgeranyl transferase type II alpha subunit n=1 Tax=Scheffersomyces xylosifermentans TaxID=1304137 RepID=UPI00315D096C